MPTPFTSKNTDQIDKKHLIPKMNWKPKSNGERGEEERDTKHILNASCDDVAPIVGVSDVRSFGQMVHAPFTEKTSAKP